MLPCASATAATRFTEPVLFLFFIYRLQPCLACHVCRLQAADTYVLDPEMAAQLKASNPQAFRNVLGRCLEAAGRGLWQPQEELIAKLRAMYGEMDDELEGIK